MLKSSAILSVAYSLVARLQEGVDCSLAEEDCSLAVVDCWPGETDSTSAEVDCWPGEADSTSAEVDCSLAAALEGHNEEGDVDSSTRLGTAYSLVVSLQEGVD